LGIGSKHAVIEYNSMDEETPLLIPNEDSIKYKTNLNGHLISSKT
jgi:hypothetical protein